ncbi:hypothetical protein AVEN_14912-1 [Araneus ventricosus]|uniref:Uncharacterized protein n=1 Tax=Araneus ventricosus TaxID=182803 RepID=A0A4Y2JRD0_ARAVE|nr:hypothetical protein AVEN_14912-1 [Araneus ventricosus]
MTGSDSGGLVLERNMDVSDDTANVNASLKSTGGLSHGHGLAILFPLSNVYEQGNEHYRKNEADTSCTVRGSYGYIDIQSLYRVEPGMVVKKALLLSR